MSMSLVLLLVALALLLASALAALLLLRRDGAALAAGSFGALAACAVGLSGAGLALFGGVGRGAADLRLAWSLPVGGFHLGVDALSAFFLLCVFLVAGLAALYGRGYLAGYAGQRRLAVPAALFNLLVASMAGVALARDGVLFLMAWEVMSLSAFFLVTFEDERDEVRRAGITYLIASHAGVAFLFALFAMLARHAGSFDFDAVAAAGAPPAAGAVFLVALVGFGAKAGFWPMHIWLPDAHPAAPSHVSALMSGVMIKLGIYGLLRTLTFLGTPPAWWGGFVVGVGLVSGLSGVLLALAQHDLKRLLAYHSVENVGIITLGVGLGLLGRAFQSPEVAFLGFAGALLHVLNHGLFKGLLFQGAGSVLHATGTRQIDQLGGLLRRMPATAATFLVGAIAICGLPPLNGFVSEWLIYVGAFRSGSTLPGSGAVCALAALVGLALIGGLASACFVKAFGVVFLGEPRSEACARAHEAPAPMRAAMLAAALLCVAIGLFPRGALALIDLPASQLAGARPPAVPGVGPLVAISHLAAALAILVGVLALLRRALLARRPVDQAATWGCGYEAPSPRMQYTAASFAQPVLAPFSPLLPHHGRLEAPRGFFPEGARVEERIGDLAGERLLVPAARRLIEVLGQVRFLQHGKLHLYLVYILVTLVALLAWQLAH